jgi:hypothetical protein
MLPLLSDLSKNCLRSTNDATEMTSFSETRCRFIDHCFSGDFVGISQNVSLTAMRSFDSRFHTSLHISENELTHQTVLSLHYKPRFVQEITALQILNGLLKIHLPQVTDKTLSHNVVFMKTNYLTFKFNFVFKDFI